MADINRFSNEILPDSIVSDSNKNYYIDYSAPLTFIDWIKHNNYLFSSVSDLLKRYQNYLNNWYEAKNQIPVNDSISIKDLYVNLLNEIVLNYSSIDERRFLQNIDPNNNRDLAIAVPFFAQKVKNICLYFSTLRDKAKNTVVEYNLKGSNFGLERLIYNEISKSLEVQDLVDIIKTLNLSVSSVRDNILVELEENYDLYENYFDIQTNTASAYNSFDGFREKYFNFNTYEIKPELFLDFDQAIIDAVKSYPFFLIETGTNNFSINFPVTSARLDLLKDSDYINLINTGQQKNLSLNNEAAEITKYIASDFYYLSTGDTVTNYISGKLFTADSPFANFLNKNTPTVAAIPSLEYLRTPRQVGLFFKPDKTGLLSFNNFDFVPFVNTDALSANTLYVFPDPNLYGNIAGTSNLDQTTPLSFNENNQTLRSSFVNSFKFGTVKSDPLLPTFRGYQSREQTLVHTNQGLSRYVDYQDFFNKPEKKDKWSNEDVFKLIPVIEFPIDQRTQTLLSLNETLTQYKNDVYGNDFGLYKFVYPFKDTSSIIINSNANASKTCLIVDGHLFFDPVSGYNFNFDQYEPALGYSGVTLRSVIQIPPGSGYFTHLPAITAVSPLSTNAYNNGVPTFTLTGNVYSIASYLMQPETFCAETVETFFACNIRDGLSFVSPSSGFLTDSSSDDPYFNISNGQLYYDILAEAGMADNPPTYRGTSLTPASFTFTAPISNIYVYDCSYFIVSSFSNQLEPCISESYNSSTLFLDSFFLDVKIPQRDTVYVPTLSVNQPEQSVYKTRYENYGKFYFRNSNTSLITPVSSALSSVFIKYSPNVQDEVSSKVINFDVYYDILQIETLNYIVFDKIEFSYETNLIRSSSNNELVVFRGYNHEFEKISTVWFNEKENNLVFAKTTLFNQGSSTNFKIIYPIMYSLDLNTLNLKQIYPIQSQAAITINDLNDFGLSGSDLNIDLVSIDKPIMSYSAESGVYSLTYLAKDTSDLFYIFITTFKYLNGILSNIKNTMYNTNMDILHTNFSNPLEALNFGVEAVLGTPGEILSGAFVFGA
jgi:hypothetical protein